MSTALSIYCPHCHRHTALSVATANYETFRDSVEVEAIWRKQPGEVWWMGVCNSCAMPVLVRNDGDVIFPAPLPTPTDYRIPEHIRVDLEEAKLCFNVGAYRGCAVLARRSMQAACLEIGAKKRDLRDQIDELHTQGLITNDLKEWAHEIRYVGNDAAHPNKEDVTEDDAIAILQLCEQFMQVIFVTPALAKELRTAREKK